MATSPFLSVDDLVRKARTLMSDALDALRAANPQARFTVADLERSRIAERATGKAMALMPPLDSPEAALRFLAVDPSVLAFETGNLVAEVDCGSPTLHELIGIAVEKHVANTVAEDLAAVEQAEYADYGAEQVAAGARIVLAQLETYCGPGYGHKAKTQRHIDALAAALDGDDPAAVTESLSDAHYWATRGLNEEADRKKFPRIEIRETSDAVRWALGHRDAFAASWAAHRAARADGPAAP